MFFPIKDYNPTRSVAYITIIIIVINVLVFFFQGVASEKKLPYYINHYSLVPYEITHFSNVKVLVGRDSWGYPVFEERNTPPILSLFFSIFMHGSFMHLFGNMLFLWIFGNNIEDYLGKFMFILFYLLSGFAASMTHILFNAGSTIPVIGASGAVSGVMGAYLILYPKAKVKTLILIIIFITFVDIPASIFLIIWLVFQFFFMGSGNIAWLAHVGGFIFGAAFIKIYQKRRTPVKILPDDLSEEEN